MQQFIDALLDAIETHGSHIETIDRGEYIDSTWSLGGHRWHVRQASSGEPLEIQLVGTRESIYADE